MLTPRKLTALALAAVFVLAFAAGFLALPQDAQACIPYEGCPDNGCVTTEWRCVSSCGIGNRWAEVTYCINGGKVVAKSCTNYPC